ncbi:PorP/SprF family type IX secretion system membrane protein [Filimonas effusa]|uniref:Type IX secretion system membrane protein PorP/SprF n=1 Tax=Filimonas effusa TaxID=2508721 RepID=A0A4Q1D8Z1_9BACT|nr:PorP/SprF family type IX secretion system membrane protein [Filimonas effusa]RXK85834.1 type IX secretion system membrane protein PorP/SprF [Filimonas effusa]
MRNKYKLMLLVLVLCAARLNAQVDPHFSGYYIYPSWLNPALTGTFDGSYRVAAIYRNQWASISAPFETIGVNGEFTTEKNLNVGVSLLRQTAGDGGYSYTTGYGSVSYTGLKFGKEGMHRVHFGLQAGFIQRRFDRSKLSFGSQWNAVTGYNPNLTPNEELSRTSAAAFDAGAGVMYFDATPGKKLNLFGGFAASHLSQPDDKFSATGTEKVPVRYTIHAGARIAVSNEFSITPNVLYLRQRSAEEKMIGAYGQYIISDETNLMGGINYRFKDAFSPFVGFTYKNIMFGAAYDVNNSDLGKIVNGANSFEFSITIIGLKKTKTPEVEFVCPRL